MDESKILYLIDGTAYIHRAYHAIRGLASSDGQPTNAVFGFTRMLIKLMEDRAPAYIAMFFDAKGPTFRHEMYSEYKANRPPMSEDLVIQLPHIKAVTKAYNLPILEMSGYEADDLIGTVATKAEAEGFSVVMVTGDKDFKQLVTDRICIWDPMKDETLDRDSIREKDGILPEQHLEVLGLAGDSADNIPGVPGVGPKTAVRLVQQFGNMETLYQEIEKVSQKKLKEKLTEFRDQAFMSRRLAKIDTQVPMELVLEDFIRKEPDHPELARLFQKLEFRQLQKDTQQKTDLSEKKYSAVMDMDGLERLVQRAKACEMFSLDTETTSQDPMRANLVGISISFKADEAFYIPVGHTGADAESQLPLDRVLETLRPVLQDPRIVKIGQNIKYDWIVLNRHGVNLGGVTADTMVASYLLNPGKRAHNLDQIALDFLGHKTISYKETVGKGNESKGFGPVSLQKAVPYACEDADITFQAYGVLEPKLKEVGLVRLMEEIEMPLVPVLMRMEMNGIGVDVAHLKGLSESFESQLVGIERDVYELAGEEFNIRSSQQLGKILFEKLGLPVMKKTKKKTGYSTDVDVLTTLADQHELPALILRHRTLAKLKSTYADALSELVHPQTGRIHTSFNQTVTATGRLSSSDPNLQNIPIRTEEGRQIREAFIPRPGWYLLSADYSQVELRILAHCSEDPILIEAFKNDEDIHTRTATEVFQVFPTMINDELRRQAKAINFGIIYGMSPFGLSKQLNISQKMAKTYIDNYFRRYKGVKAFMDQTVEAAGKTRATSTLMGRIRQLPDITSSNHNIRSFAERTAINTPIQGSAADLIKLAMIRCDGQLKENGLQSAMLLTVHDELVFEVPPEEMETVKTLVKEVMETVWSLHVPLKVNLAWGKNWAEAH